MAAVTVTDASTNQTVNPAETNTNWANLGGGGPAPAAEPQLKYQGSNAVNRKVTSTGGTLTGVEYDHSGTGSIDMTAAANRLWIAKVYVADFGDLNTTTGVILRIGDSSASYREVTVAGSSATKAVFSAYSARGGYLLIALDPNITQWDNGNGGTPTLTAVDYFGAAASFVTGGAKSENFALDAIDVGTGLALYGGDGGDTDGVFQDFVDTDQNTVANRWGYVSQDGADAPITIRGMLEIGTTGAASTATEFSDSEAVLLFPDGYHSAGLFGVTVDLGNGSTIVTLDHTAIGLGVDDGTNDTRPDLIFTGTSGAATLSALIINHRNVTLTSAVDCDGADIQCDLLTQSSGEIQNSVIRTTSATSVACLQDPTFGTTTDLHDTEFIQEGAGHALEIDTAGTYTFTNLFFTGYGANTTDSAALDITETTGTVTINVSGGDSPTYKTAGATVVINNTVNYDVAGLQDGTELTILDRDVSMLDVNVGGSNQVFGQSTGNQRVGQSFQVAATAKAERVRLRIRKVGTPSDGVTVRLISGTPGNTLLAESLTVSASLIGTNYSEFDVDLTEKNSLTSATTYSIEIQRTGSLSDTDYYEIEYDSTGTHGSGTIYTYAGSWSSGTGDLWFSIMEAASDNELFHVESTSGVETYSHGGTVKEIEVLALATNYLPILVIDSLGTVDSSIALSQSPDRVYSNP
jgi:hypothetical protein